MTLDTLQPQPEYLVTKPKFGLRIRRALQDTNTILWRDTIRTLRQPDTLVFAVVMGVFFLVLFNYVFGGAIGAGAQINYLEFLVPGVLVITALQGAQQTSISLATDLTEGVVDRFMTLPMSQVAVIAGRTISDAVRNIFGLVLVMIIAVIMGYRFASLPEVILAIFVATALGFGVSWMGAAIAAKVRKPDVVGMLSMFWLFPLMLASTAFAPADTMPGWLQPFVEYQPISVASDAVRGLASGNAELSTLLACFAWIVGLLVVFIPWSMHLYRKNR